jgi:hypothetical protein
MLEVIVLSWFLGHLLVIGGGECSGFSMGLRAVVLRSSLLWSGGLEIWALVGGLNPWLQGLGILLRTKARNLHLNPALLCGP